MENHLARHLEGRQPLADEVPDIVLGQRRACVALDGRVDAFAKLIVGNAENRAVLNAGTALKHSFDFGWIDIHPARDDHVPLAVVEEQIAIGIEVADVAASDETVDFDGAAVIVAAVVVEIGIGRQSRVDFAADPGRLFATLLVEDLDRAAGSDTTHCSRPRKPVLRSADGGDAGFGPAVGFHEDRPPPGNHRPLDIRRTRRTRVQHQFERRHVVVAAHLFRELEKPHKECRHHHQRGQTVAIDLPQQFFRIEAR